MLKNFIFIIISASLMACSTTSKTVKSCYDTESKSGWNECTRSTAVNAFEFAQMSANNYAFYAKGGEISGSNAFYLGDKFEHIKRTDRFDSGLTYDVYRKTRVDGTYEMIIAFKGTDGTKDWKYGNIGSQQRWQSIEAYDQVRDSFAGDISVTGHSLGGALATQVSLCRKVKTTYIFDSSPRFRAKC